MLNEEDNKSVKVLLIEDNPADALMIRRSLGREGRISYETEHAQTLSEGLELIAGGEFDVLLLDLSLPDSSGMDTLLQALAKAPELPVIVLTGLRDESLGISMVKYGAQDYIVKDDLDHRLLKRSVNYAIERKLISETARRLAKEQSAMAEIGRIISSSLEIEQVYKQFAQQVHLLVPFDRISINIFDFDSYTFQTTYIMGLEVPERIKNVTLPLGESVSEQVIRTRSEILIEAEEETEISDRYPNLLPSFRAGLRTFLTVPLMYKDEVVGALHLRSCTPKAYLDYHRALAGQIGNQIAGAIASAQLFREFTQAQESLIQAERKYRNLIEGSSDPIVVLQDGKAVYVNHVFEEVIGTSSQEGNEETQDQSFFNAVVAEDGEMVRDFYRRRLQGEDVPDQYEVRLQTHDEGTVVMEVKPRIIEYEGHPATLITMRDVTQRKLLEEQLLHSQKMQAIGTLAGGMAHDFNNMLSVIISYTQLASNKAPQHGPVTRYLQEVTRAAERSSHLTRQLLTFSRRQIVELRVLNLNDIIIEMQKMLRRLVAENIELVILPSSQVGQVNVDPAQIEHVIVNLVVNARDAMPDGGTITIETFNTDIEYEASIGPSGLTPGEYVALVISDIGSGMSEEVMSHIFEPFFTTKSVDKGTGLGLSTCYGIVAEGGGAITVESELDSGSKFTVYLPRVDAPSDPLPLRDESGYLPTGHETVLLAEDEPMMREVVAHLLGEQGYTVLEATNGQDALRVCEQHTEGKIDLLITDVIMPLMSGTQLAKSFRKDHPDSRVLYVSGYNADTALEEEILLDGVGFMQKPFTPTELAHKVRELLESHQEQSH